MTPFDARKIIGALAEGINPETGELLSEQSVFNAPQVIRSLFVAMTALDKAAKSAERKNSLPANAGHAWSESEDKELLAIFDAGEPVKEIAARHGRTQGAIAARLIRLGRIRDPAEIYSRT